MQESILDRAFHVEVLSPRQDSETLDNDLQVFAERYRRVVGDGHVVCIPDNPMGKLAFQGTDLIRELGLPVPPGQVSVHVNTFHSRADLDAILASAGDLGITHLLAVSGDGSERLPKLRAEDIGMNVASVTSVELLRTIHRTCPGRFVIGVAFNPYEPQDEEIEKLHRKIDAGAAFITTQPIIDRHAAVDALRGLGLPLIVECWMSRKLHLLSDCVGYEIPEDTVYDPLANLSALLRHYPESACYLALTGFKTQFSLLNGVLSEARG